MVWDIMCNFCGKEFQYRNRIGQFYEINKRITCKNCGKTGWLLVVESDSLILCEEPVEG